MVFMVLEPALMNPRANEFLLMAFDLGTSTETDVAASAT
jgi:hypothetical protein